MKNINKVSAKKQEAIDKINNSEFKVGETISVNYNAFWSEQKKDDKTLTVTVIKVNIKTLVVESVEYRASQQKTINKTDVVSRNIRNAGENPFEQDSCTRPVAYELSSILFNLDVLGDKRDDSDTIYKINDIVVRELNWNPYVYVNNVKQYYQRDFVWTTEQKQNLITSIYLGIDCGKILIRKRSFASLRKLEALGEQDLAFNDIVDGKQRLDAIRGFIQGEFTDAYGNYYADLSYQAQHDLVCHQLFGFSEMDDDCTDAQVLKQFLKMNFEGVPQSKEHLEFVKSLI